MKLAWVTDPHFDHLQPLGAKKFGAWLQKQSVDAVLLTGDLSTYRGLTLDLIQFEAGFGKPVFFVLGNHDYYYSSFEAARQSAQVIHESDSSLYWLDQSGVVELTASTALVGSGGWYDARAGSPLESTFEMPDFTHIEDLKKLGRVELIDKCREFSAKQAEELRPHLWEAARKYARVVVATHMPPFKEVARYLNQPSSMNTLPWYTNLTLGNLLAEAAYEHSETHFIVLCGHTHFPHGYVFNRNMVVFAGVSHYQNPQISRIFEFNPEGL
jgi:3',5'-cyclic AMP phosphodiesterase CpdA